MAHYDDYVHVSFRREDFRVTFLQPFLLVFFSALIISELFFFLSGNNGRSVMLVILPTTVTVLCVVAVLILQARYHFGVGPAGIRCYDFWCRPHATSWDDVSDIHFVRTAGLEYLQVIVRDSKKAIWIPLFVRRDQLLRRMLMDYTSSSLELQEKLAVIWAR